MGDSSELVRVDRPSPQSWPTNDSGQFTRQPTTFRDWIRADEVSRYTPEPGRYHLYVSWACPWAHRTLIVRRLRKLEDVVSLSVVGHFLGEHGWEFTDEPGTIADSINHARYLREIYFKAKPDYKGRFTVPVLWDKKTKTIVNNESREIIRMFDTAFAHLGDRDINLCPPELQDRIDETIDAIYEPINNGVYRAGFARTQRAYDEAVTELFEALDHWEEVLSGQRYLTGDRLTEADVCLFTTLLRFDPVYHTHFKCNLRRLCDYSNLWSFTKAFYQMPGMRALCNLDHIKCHYYRSHESLNPKRIVPKGPIIDFDGPHDRDRFARPAEP